MVHPKQIERLTAAMRVRGIAIEQLAAQLGIAPATLADWLAGRYPIPDLRIRDLESALELDQPAVAPSSGVTRLDPRIARLIQLAKGLDDEMAGEGSASGKSASRPSSPERDDTALHVVMQQAILKARQTLGLTQAEIANRIGVSAPLLSQWARGHRTIPDQHLLELAKVLGIDFRAELVRHFRALAEELPAEDRELAQLIANLNTEAKAPLLRLLHRLQAR